MKKNKVLIICYAENHVDKVLPLIKEFKEDEIVFVGIDNESQRKLKEKNIPYKIPQDYVSEESMGVIGSEAIALVRKWGDSKVDDSTLKEFLTYQDMSFWDIIDSNFSVFLFERVEVLQNIKLMKSIMEKESPDSVVLVDVYNLIGKSALVVANSMSIPAKVLGSQVISYLKYYYRTYLLHYSYRYLMRLRESEREYSTKIRNLFYRPKKETVSSDKKKILIIPFIQTMTPVIVPVIRELEKNENNQLLVLRYDLLRDRMKRDLEREGIQYNTFEGYCTREVKTRINRRVKFIKNRWNTLKNDVDFKKSITYLNIPIWDLVEDLFLFYFSTRVRFIEIMRYIETMRHILDLEQPDIIVTLDDLSEVGNPTMMLGKSKEIPTLCIQHGAFREEDSFIFGPSLADKIAVSGEYIKEFLIKRDVRPEQLVVTGFPKFDTLFQGEKLLNKEEIYKKLGISPDKEIILFTTQPRKENEENAQAVFKAMKEFPDKHLVVKLHPRESDKTLYLRIAKKIGLANFTIVRDFNLYDLLSICELNVTGVSTTGLEAMILGKPVISMNLKRVMDRYMGSGVTINVHKADELASIIKGVLENPQIKKDLNAARERYVYDNAYKIDGQASKRVVDLINNMSN